MSDAKANSKRQKTIKLREQYFADGTIVENEFVRDKLFESSSVASNFVMGNNKSGPSAWKSEDGISMKDELE